MVVFGIKLLYSVKGNVVGQKCCIRSKVVLFGQKWLNLGKVVVYWQKCLNSVKSGCILVKMLYSGKVFVFG